MYSLQDIATGGAAAVTVAAALTQALKRLIELKWDPKDPAHDTLVEMGGLLVSALVVLVAALLTTPAAPFSTAWWTAALAAVMAGIGIKYGSAGFYKALTSGKVDGHVLTQLANLAATVEQLAAADLAASQVPSVPPSAILPPLTQPEPSMEQSELSGPPVAPGVPTAPGSV